MNGLRDFVPASFPLPWMPIYDGMGEFVSAGFPLPQNPIYPSANGSLPKAPPMPMALIGHGNGKANGCGDCGCNGGMGALTSDTIIPQASLPTFLQGDTWITGFPNVYVALGVVVVGVMFMGGSARRGRR